MRILVLRTDRIGDIVLSEPVVEVLGKRFDNARIDFVSSLYSAPVLYNNPHISNIYELQGRGMKDVIKISGTLSKINYDLSISIDTHPVSYIIPFLSKVKVRIGQVRRLWSILVNNPVSFSRRGSRLHEVVLNQMLLKPLGLKPVFMRPKLYLSSSEIDIVISKIRGLGYEDGKSMIVIHPGSLGSSAHPPVSVYSRLASVLVNYGQVIVVGRRDFDNIDIFRERDGIFVIDDMNIREYIALLSKAGLFIGGDTGPMHIASALNIPVVALFSPIIGCGPERWGPLSDKYIVYMPDDLECKGRCRKCKYYNCMERMNVNDIIAGIISLLKLREV
ncbi:MAG: glycosyltransferase family 9 protein [bacterium]